MKGERSTFAGWSATQKGKLQICNPISLNGKNRESTVTEKPQSKLYFGSNWLFANTVHQRGCNPRKSRLEAKITTLEAEKNHEKCYVYYDSVKLDFGFK